MIKSISRAAILILFSVICSGASSFAFGQGTWKALIIGIGEYNDRRINNLRTPVPDGKELAGVLAGQYGFEVTSLFDRDASWKNIDREIRNLIKESRPEDSVLIYYGGHGDLDKELDEGWWFPVDTVPGDRQTYLQNSDLRELIKKMRARHVLLISDSCFAASLFGDYRSLSTRIDDRYHQRLFQGKSRLGLTSGGKEPVLDGGSDGHSIFAYHLLKFLKTTERDVFSAGELFTEIAPVITNNSPQKPEFLPILYTGHENGEFVFVRSGTDIIQYISTEVSTPPPLVSDIQEWYRKPTAVFGGVAICFLLIGLLVTPRVMKGKKAKAFAEAVGNRDIETVTRLMEGEKISDEPLLKTAGVLLQPVKGVVLESLRQKIIIAPGIRQGLGRGERWPFALADPHISRKPHGWLIQNDNSLTVSRDGGEVVVNGEEKTTAELQQNDTLALGPITEMSVERFVPGLGSIFHITSGPEQGKRLLLVVGSIPLNWLTGSLSGEGQLQWVNGRPQISIGADEQNPLQAMQGNPQFPILEGDVLKLGEQEWVVKII